MNINAEKIAIIKLLLNTDTIQVLEKVKDILGQK